MQYKSFLIKYAEIGVKGKNRFMFEDALVTQIRHALKDIDGDFMVVKESGRIYATAESEYDFDEAVETLKRIFGIAAICPMVQVDDNGYEDLKKQVLAYVDEVYEDKNFTFKVNARRGNKKYPVNSDQINRDLGEVILEAFPETKVDVHHPEVMLHVEVRNRINIYSIVIPGPGGMPVGTNGKAMLLLSGGIDSPVAGYMIAKRGVELECVHFFSYPYTSELAKDKVLELARLMTRYCGRMTVNIVGFTEIQEAIRDNCPEEFFTLVMRRFMMKIAERIARDHGCGCLVTGENLGQVASQTMEAMAVTGACVDLPIFQPLIGMDKEEIVTRARQIGTMETSILPYEDCCTVFTPRHPKTKPTLAQVDAACAPLDMEGLIARALENTELVKVRWHG